jgi:predicted RNase H-like HicB family nuclease
MKTYELALESGPRRKKTYVHVIPILGCMARGDTTEEAIDAAPDAIRSYLRFLKRHGEAVNTDEDFEVAVVEHITEGSFLGNGTLSISADTESVSADEVERYTRWLEWMGDDLVDHLSGLATLDDTPERGRSIRHIVQHVIGSERGYVTAIFGSDKEMNKIAEAADRGEGDPLDHLTQIRQLSLARLRAMTPDERAFSRQSGQILLTARRLFRRTLEHQWEHLMEIMGRAER